MGYGKLREQYGQAHLMMQLKLDTHGLKSFGLETFVYSETGWRANLMVVPFT